jgi:UDPglucose 6-dehydrogenase
VNGTNVKIAVIGAGYVGLTTAACLAQIGHDVFCGENDSGKLEKLQNGVMPFFEPNLEKIVEGARKTGRLRVGSTEEAIVWGKAIFICVGTPPLPNGDADLSYIESTARSISKHAEGYRLIVEKSTVPVQTGDQLRRHLAMHRSRKLDYEVASNPEFLREGSAVDDFLHPDRIVIGVESTRAEELLREIYEPIIQRRFLCPIHRDCSSPTENVFLVTDTNSAELIKHASNSFLAMKISFINMVADLCEVVGADIGKVSQGMGLDPRIGNSFLNAGIGFGGFCFPKDVQAFIRIAEKSGCNFALLREVERINQQRIVSFTEKVRQELWNIRGKKIAIWGLAFKPNTDDIRFSPSLEIARLLMSEGAEISAYDPQASEKAKAEQPNITYCRTPYEAAERAEAILLVTEWDEFSHIDWRRIRGLMDRLLVIDGRNALDSREIVRCGFHYVSVGRPPITPEDSQLASADRDEFRLLSVAQKGPVSKA